MIQKIRSSFVLVLCHCFRASRLRPCRSENSQDLESGIGQSSDHSREAYLDVGLCQPE